MVTDGRTNSFGLIWSGGMIWYGCRRTSKKLLNAQKLALPAGSFLEVSALGNLPRGVTSGGHGSPPGNIRGTWVSPMGVTRTIAATCTAGKILPATPPVSLPALETSLMRKSGGVSIAACQAGCQVPGRRGTPTLGVSTA